MATKTKKEPPSADATKLEDPWWLNEQRLDFGQLGRKLGDVKARTVRKWRDVGVWLPRERERVLLECYRLGGSVYTTWEAYLRFDQKVNS